MKYLFLVFYLLLVSRSHAQHNPSDPARSVKVIMIMEITVHDTILYQQYKTEISPIVKKYGGKYIVRSGKSTTGGDPQNQIIPGEGGWNPDRIIVTEWDSMDALKKFSQSEECIRISEMRKKSATSRSVIVNEYQ